MSARAVAVIDIDPVAARAVAERHGIDRVYTSAEEAARAGGIDAVVVGTPPNRHADHVELFAPRGVHILCEKPMASTVEDCRRIIR